MEQLKKETEILWDFINFLQRRWLKESYDILLFDANRKQVEKMRKNIQHSIKQKINEDKIVE